MQIVPIVAALIALRTGWSGDAVTAMVVAVGLALSVLMVKNIDHILDKASLPSA